MTYLKSHAFSILYLAAFALLFAACDTDDDMDGITGEASFEITDAPIDDSDVEAVFVTVADVRVDGESISGFEGRKTIDLTAYQNGNTEALGIAELETGTYSNVTLVLDYEEDADGNTPGCYVRDTDQNKHPLRARGDSESTGSFTLVSEDFEVTADQTTNIVLDFDLRKTVRYEENPEPDMDEYELAARSETEAAIRVVNKENSGKVDGSCSDNLNVAGDYIVAYVYTKGSYDRETETQPQGSDEIMFRGAVSSSIVADNGDFQVNFVKSGDYEIHFAGYEDEDQDGRSELKGMLDVELLTSLNLLDLQVNANATTTVDVNVLGLLP